MKIEKINNDKLKFIFSINELEKESIDYQAFMSGSEKCENIINGLLFIAKDELDFDTNNCNLEIETFEINHGNFIITITRDETNIKAVKAKRKIGNFNDCSCIYEFENYNNYIDFMQFLMKYFKDIFEICKMNSKTYPFEKKMIFIIDTSHFSNIQAGIFNSIITEFANFKSNSSILISKIEELS